MGKPKTLDFFKNQVAKEQGHRNWAAFERKVGNHASINTNAVMLTALETAAERYADQYKKAYQCLGEFYDQVRDTGKMVFTKGSIYYIGIKDILGKR